MIDEPIELVDEPPGKRRSKWCRDALREAEKHGAQTYTSREHKQPDRYSGYVALMNSISELDPLSYKEAA